MPPSARVELAGCVASASAAMISVCVPLLLGGQGPAAAGAAACPTDGGENICMGLVPYREKALASQPMMHMSPVPGPDHADHAGLEAAAAAAAAGR